MQHKSKHLLVNSAVSGAMLAVSTTAIAIASTPALAQKVQTTSFTEAKPSVLQPVSTATPENANALSQVTSVSQLSDVQPTDWAFQALQSLVERYGCIAGYPDGTYRGNRALTRYEFAAGLNACLDRVNELIASATANQVTREDLATLQRLQEEFAAEVATLRGRTDALEATAAELEANQFSTTTQLTGEVVVGAAGIISGQDVDGNDLDESIILGQRTRLELNTSFTGRDQLYTLISTGNFPGFSDVTGITEGELSFTQDEANDIGLETLFYSFPIGERTEVVLGFTGTAFYDFTDTLTVMDGDGGSGALSAFGTRNPIYNLGDGAGVGIRQQLGNRLELSLGYLATDASNPLDGSGLVDGPYAGIAQLVLRPSDRFNVGLTYINSYKASDTGAGSGRASFARFDDAFFENLNLEPIDVPTVSNSYGVQLSWQISNNIVLGGWAGYTNTRLLSTLGGLLERGDSDIFNYAVTLAFPDLGREGNLLGIIVGMEPRLTNTGITLNPAAAAELVAANPNVVLPDLGEDEDMSLHIEAFYQLQLTDNFAITPGVIWITAPDFNNANQDIVIGAIRTTFSF